MKYLDFEKHIKKELSNSKETVQMDALLASLNLGNKRPKKKGFALWMIIPFLLLVISIVAWQELDLSKATFSDSNLEQRRTTIITNSQQGNTDINDKNESDLALLASSKEENEINKTTENSKLVKSTENTAVENNSNRTKTITKNNTISKNKQSENIIDGFEHIEDKASSEDLLRPIKVSNQNSSYIYKQALDNNTINAENSSLNTENENNNFSSVEVKSLLSRGMVTIEGIDNSIVALKESNVEGTLFKRMRINCPSFENLGWHLALIPEVGLFYPIKTLENTSPEASLAFNERIKSESTLEGLEIGLYGMLVRDNVPLFLKAGVSYARISERMSLQYEYTEQDTTIGIISSTISGNGDTITHIYGDIITETTYKGNSRQHHYIHLFDIPISLGYTTYIGGLDIAVEAGVKVNFMTRATGKLLTSKSGYTKLSFNKLFKNRIGVNYFGGLMIGRNFDKFGDIYIAPRFTYYPDSFNNQHNTISQKYFNIGISAGVVYKIN